MTQYEVNKLASDIIAQNIYLTLSTTDGLQPWVAPVFYCKDDKNNFYFISQLESLHIRHILKNPQIAFTIYDSHALEGEGNGIQATGTVKILDTEEEIKDALIYYHSTFIK